MNKKIVVIAGLGALMVGVCAYQARPTPAPPPGDEATPSSSDRSEVLQAAQALFDHMAARDTAAIRRLLLPEGMLVAVTDSGVRISPTDAFIAAIGSGGSTVLERMWEPEVRIERGIATVWTPYDLHIGDTFSHCGVDAFQLAHADGRWRIVTVTYTVQRTNCSPSPLDVP